MIERIIMIMIGLLATISMVLGFLTRVLGLSLFGADNVNQGEHMVIAGAAWLALTIATDNHRRINKLKNG